MKASQNPPDFPIIPIGFSVLNGPPDHASRAFPGEPGKPSYESHMLNFIH